MGKIVTRYNFETNSSSMHSLSYRRDGGEYTAEELEHSESMEGEPLLDVIMTLDDYRVLTDKEEMRDELWIWGDNKTLRVWSSDIDYINSPMEVMASIRDKLHYAIASALSNPKGKEKIREIKETMKKLLPEIELDIDNVDDDNRCSIWSRGHYLNGGVEQDILFPFLEKNDISMEEFLTHRRYIVIVDYSEYCKMKFLNMVDESKIISIFPNVCVEHRKMRIENGVWVLNSGDITFGRSPFRVLGTVEGKARYALAANRSENMDEILAIMQEVYPEIKSIQLPHDVYSEDEIDHGYCEECAIPTNIPLRDFILDKHYVVISDGDEYCVWNSFKKTKLFNHDEYPEETIDEDY